MGGQRGNETTCAETGCWKLPRRAFRLTRNSDSVKIFLTVKVFPSRSAMKCQQCDRPATFHITELTVQARRSCTSARSTRANTSPHRPASRPTPATWPPRLPSKSRSKWPSARPPRSWHPRPAGLSGLRHHVLRISQPRPARLPTRLRGLPAAARAAGPEHSRRDRARGQASAPDSDHQRRAHAVDPAPPRMKEAGREREYEHASKLRDEIAKSRPRARRAAKGAGRGKRENAE